MRPPRFESLLGSVGENGPLPAAEPIRLRMEAARLRERVGTAAMGLDDPRYFDRALRRLIDRGPGALRPRDDLALAARLGSRTDLLDGEPLTNRLDHLRPLLDRWSGKIASSVLGPLLWQSAYLAYFHADGQQRELLRVFLGATLPAIDTGPTAPGWLPVVLAHRGVLDERPARRYATDWLKGDTDALDELRLRAKVPTGSWFWEELVGELLATIRALSDPAFRTFLPRALELPRVFPRRRDEALAAILDRYAALPELTVHEGLLQHVVDAWGNPQLDLTDRSHRWSQVSDAAVRMVCRWLAEDDLKDFFELIKSSREFDDVDRRRSEYWVRFLGRMQFTKLVFGPGLDSQTNRDVRRFVDKRRKRLSWLGGSTASNVAIVMRIGDWWLIEFAETGNACYLYRNDQRTFDVSAARIERGQLADYARIRMHKADKEDAAVIKQKGMGRLKHFGDWEATFDNVLSALGIWPDSVTRPQAAPRAAQTSTRSKPQPAARPPSPKARRAMKSVDDLPLGASLLGELRSLTKRTVDNRNRGGALWFEVEGHPSEELRRAMASLGFRQAKSRGFYL